MSSLQRTKKKKLYKSISEMSKEALQETLKKKRECNARAQKIVEALCEKCIDEQWFLKNLEFINQSHFEDITIERALLKICGYPLCDKKLEKIALQQYHISSRCNKVFDITERKNFCSPFCYKASNYIKNQLLTSPLWFRDHDIIPQFTTLKSNKFSLGEEVQICEKIKLEPEDYILMKKNKNNIDSKNAAKLQENDSSLTKKNENSMKEKSVEESQVDTNVKNICPVGFDLAKLQENSSSLTKKSENSIQEKSVKEFQLDTNVKNICPVEKEMNKNVNDRTKEENSSVKFETAIKESEKNLNVLQKENKNYNKLEMSKCSEEMFNYETNFFIEPVHKTEEKKILNEKVVNTKIFTQPDVTSKYFSKSTTKNKVDTITKVENCIFEWFSINSLLFLIEEKRLKKLFKHKADKIKEVLNSKLLVISHNEKIERMIKLYELFNTNSFNENMVKPNLKPLPDYSVLKKEGENIEIKVRAFFKGELELKKPTKEKETEEKKKEVAHFENDIFLPLIDDHAQVALRRKIVLDKLTKFLPELLLIFNTDYVLQMNDVRQLISTFSLTSHNITFKPMEWQLIGIILLKLLSIKDKYLDIILKQKLSQEKLAIILTDFKLPVHYLVDLIKKLTDIENIVQKLE